MRKSLFTLGALATLQLFATVANAAVVDFEDLNNDGVVGYTLYGDQFDSGGYHFASVDFAGNSDAMASWTIDFGVPPYSGSVSPFANFFGDRVDMTKIGGGSFDVISIDLADVFMSATGGTIEFVGTHSNATTTTVNVVLTDGSSLDTYMLAGMTDLVNLRWGNLDGSTNQFDNINLGSTVPEPASLAVLGLGAFALLRKRRK